MRIETERRGRVLGIAALLIVVGAVLIALPFVLHAKSVGAQNLPKQAQVSSASAVKTTIDASASSVATDTTTAPNPAAELASSTAATVAPLVAITAPPTAAPVAATPSGPSLDAYRGLGSWIDIYDDKAWADPSAAVADMARHGVRALYLETSNSRSSFAIKDSAAVSTFIRQAHAHGMSVVAWYLPDMTNSTTDYKRVAQAVNFRTPDAQKFDSFALDIESGAVKSETARNKALTSLSSRIRALVGRSYPLGAIIPSPTGLAKNGSYWGSLPYTMLASKYDVFVPMSYYTYHGKGASAAYADTISNVRILRAQKGCSKTPIHLIGGIAENSSTAETQAFVRAARETHCAGASFYSWPGTTSGDWKALSAIKP